MVKVTGSVQTKNGKLYALLNYKNANGKRKIKWISTGLNEDGNKRKVQRMLPEIIHSFQEELEKKINPKTSQQDFLEFMEDYLKIVKHNLSPTTHTQYVKIADIMMAKK